MWKINEIRRRRNDGHIKYDLDSDTMFKMKEGRCKMDGLNILLTILIYVIPFVILYIVVYTAVKNGIDNSRAGQLIREERTNSTLSKENKKK